MHNFILFIFSLFISFSCNAKDFLPQSKTIPFNTPEIQKVTSKKGVTAWLIEEHSTPIIAISIIFEGGISQDPYKYKGASKLFANLLNHGAGRYKSEKFHQILSENSIELSVSAGLDSIEISMEMPAKNKDMAFYLLKKVIHSPRFDYKSLAKEKASTLAALQIEKGKPLSLAYKRFFKLVFNKHPYQQIGSTAAGVKKTNKMYLNRIRRHRFAQDNLYISVVGNITKNELKTKLSKIFDSLPKHAKLKKIDDILSDTNEGKDVLRIESAQSAVIFGAPGISQTDPLYYPAIIANHIFGSGSFNSRLFKQIREKQGLTYGISSSLTNLRHSSLIMGIATSANEKMSTLIQMVKQEWNSFSQERITSEEFDNAKKYLTGSFALNFTSSIGLAESLSSIQFNNLGIDFLKNRNQRINDVTSEDLTKAIKQLFNIEKLFFVVVGKPVNL